jgi:hypothetical protein
MNLHDLAEERSLALHVEIARRLEADPGILELARRRVQAWRQRGEVSNAYVDSWERILNRPLHEVARSLTDPGEDARALRQVTPFAGVVAPRERWRIWREVRERWLASR